MRLRSVNTAKSIAEKQIQINLFLNDETLGWNLAVVEQIEHGTDTGGRGDLNGAALHTLDRLAVDFVGIGFLNETPVFLAADGDEDQDNILQGGRNGVLKNVLEQVSTIFEPQVVEQGFHDIAVTWVANGLITQTFDLADHRLCQ